MIPGLRARERYLAAAAFAALLIACAFLLFRLYDERQEVLADFRRGTWIAVQAQNEHLRLAEALARYEAEPSAENRREMLQRLDIFWSRLPIIAEGREGESVRRLPGMPELIAQMIGRLPALETVLTGVEQNDAGSFIAARTLLESYRAPLNTMVIEALHNEGYAQSRDRIEQQYTWLMVALVAMLGSGAVLVLVLRREAQSAQANYEKARLAEAEASDVKERLIDAIESISEGFILLDDAGRVLIANNRYRELYPTIADLVEPGVAFSDLVWASAALGQYETELPVERWSMTASSGWRIPAAPSNRP